jgi:hypothetical protein
MKIPLKTKLFFAWCLRRGVILTKDNHEERNWHDCTKCVFRDEEETIKHPFLQRRFARSIWSIIHIRGSTLSLLVVLQIFLAFV